MLKRLLRRVLPPLVHTVFGVAGGYMLLAALATEPWMRLAQTIEASAEAPVFSDKAVERLTERVGRPNNHLCLFGLANSRLSVAILLLRRSQASDNANHQRDAAEAAKVTAREALACDPMNANLWTVLASLESEDGVRMSRLSALLEMSRSMAPFDSQALIQRAVLMAPLLARPELRRDGRPLAEFIRSLKLLHAREGLKLLQRLDANAPPEVTSVVLSRMPPERRDILERGVLRERARAETVNKGQRFEFTPFGTP